MLNWFRIRKDQEDYVILRELDIKNGQVINEKLKKPRPHFQLIFSKSHLTFLLLLQQKCL